MSGGMGAALSAWLSQKRICRANTLSTAAPYRAKKMRGWFGNCLAGHSFQPLRSDADERAEI
jgi:hypothetical protein